MDKIKLFSFIGLLLIKNILFAQDGIHIQSIVRDQSYDVVTNKDITFRLSAIEEFEFGNPVYVETQKVKTNDFGLASLYFGKGNPIRGVFDSIRWAKFKHFLKIEIDINGSNNFQISEIQEIGSVPYAFHSKTADKLTTQSSGEIDPLFSKSVSSRIDSSDVEYWNRKQNNLFAGDGIKITNDTISLKTGKELTIGDFHQGGIIFYLYRDSNNQQHGKVLSLKKDATGVAWGTTSQTIPKCNDPFDGQSNCTNAMQFYSGDYVNALKFSVSSTSNGYKDWYMPSVFEAKMITANIYLLHQELLKNQGDGFTNSEKIWTSTEYNSFYAYSVSIIQSEVIVESKSSTKDLVVRSIRDF